MSFSSEAKAELCQSRLDRKCCALAESYDYWYVPCFFIGKDKLMEGVPSKEKVKAAMDAALAE